MKNYTDDSFKVSVWSNLKIHGIPKEGTYIMGEVVTPQGFVLAYSDDGYSGARFIWNGRMHTRQWKRRFTMAGLARKAAQFAREITK